MKHWTKFKFSIPLKNKEIFLKKNKIIEDENLTEDLKFLIEIKKANAIWHSEAEIIEYLKKNK